MERLLHSDAMIQFALLIRQGRRVYCLSAKGQITASNADTTHTET